MFRAILGKEEPPPASYNTRTQQLVPLGRGIPVDAQNQNESGRIRPCAVGCFRHGLFIRCLDAPPPDDELRSPKTASKNLDDVIDSEDSRSCCNPKGCHTASDYIFCTSSSFDTDTNSTLCSSLLSDDETVYGSDQ